MACAGRGLPGAAAARHFDGAEGRGAKVLERAKTRDRGEVNSAALPATCGYPSLIQTVADIPDLAGAYMLVIGLAEPIRVTIRGHTWRLESGRYLYCGSAYGPGGLRARVGRHMRCGKPVRWHVDQLTERGRVCGALIFPGRHECALAARLSHLPVPIPGFGSSDCRGCTSHLFAWPAGTPLWPSPRRQGESKMQRSGPVK
jgi:Uri superfamily endonuclease